MYIFFFYIYKRSIRTYIILFIYIIYELRLKVLTQKLTCKHSNYIYNLYTFHTYVRYISNFTCNSPNISKNV